MDNGNLTDKLKIKNFSKFRHWHTEVEFVYVKQGKLLLEHNEDILTLENGQFFIIASNASHTYLETFAGSEIHLVKVNIEKNRIGNDSESYKYKKSALIANSDGGFLRDFYDMMHADYGIYTDLYITGKAYQIFVYIYSGKIPGVTIIKTDTVKSSNIVFRIREFLIENGRDDVSLSSLADYLGVSKNYCSKIIKEKTNLNFSDYLNIIRIEAAEKLLVDTDMNIIEICHESGFKSIQSFNRNFIRFQGVSPRKYREIYKN